MYIRVARLVPFLALAGIWVSPLTRKSFYARPQAGKEFIEIAGTKLRLGMTKAEVSERLAGSEITKVSEGQWMIGAVGSIGFKGDKLISADRFWLKKGEEPLDGVIGALSLLNAQGYTDCRISNDVMDRPASSVRRVWIDCGAKTLILYKGQTGGVPLQGVTERLGHDGYE